MLSIGLRKFPSIPSLLGVYIRKGCGILSNALSPSIEIFIWLCLLFVHYINCFSYVKHYIPIVHGV